MTHPASASLATNPWTVVAATTAVQALASATTLSVPTIAPRLAEMLGVSPALIGYQTTFIYSGAMATSVIGGAFVRRLGAGRASQAALVLAILGALLVIGGQLWTIALGSIVMGLGYGLTNPAASHLLMRFARGPRLNLIFSIKQTGVPWGGMLAGLMLPPVALAFGWRWAVALVAVLALGLLLALALARRQWDDDRDPTHGLRQNPFAAVLLVWRSRPLRYLSFASMALSLTQMCVLAFMTTLLVSEAGFGLVEAGFVVAIMQVAGVLGRVGWGLVADRIGDGFITLMVVTGLAVLACLAASQLTPAWPAWAVYGVGALFGSTAVGWNGVFMAEVARQAPPDRIGVATGGCMMLTFSSIIFGPALFGIVSVAIGSYALTYLVVAGVASLGGLSLVVARRVARAGAAVPRT
ncbi:MFS transporter [Allostella humosa]|uniref:MFS transporter n=1 Tax=Stella humosa TaxID=94 RepID=UPI00113A2FDE|nr:MFS transporter [Stella humosa]BBK33726.1 MFS transporter [Stella humosa]